MNTYNKKLEKETRKVFHDIHLGHLEEESSKIRLSNLLSTEFLKLPEDFFTNKVCGDLGCGSAIHGTINLLNLGAKYVYSMDVDESFIEPASRILESDQNFNNRWHLDVGSLMELPYDDNFFDFVLCHGVVHHVDDDLKSLSEIYRALKKGKKAFVTVAGKGGLMTRIVMDLMRDEYWKNETAKTFIDENLSVDGARTQIDSLIGLIDDDGHPSYQTSVNFLKNLNKLVDEDLILSIRDRLAAPKYTTYSESQFTELLKKAGFSTWYRVARKLNYYNLRKIMTPLYYDFKNPLAKFLYGDGGVLNFIATK